jgi:hypothetical protein
MERTDVETEKQKYKQGLTTSDFGVDFRDFYGFLGFLRIFMDFRDF